MKRKNGRTVVGESKMPRETVVTVLQGGVEPMRDMFYGVINPRRKQEVADSRMIQEDHNAMANLSPRAINKQFDAYRFAEALKQNDDEVHEF
jgi:hypothetical protein